MGRSHHVIARPLWVEAIFDSTRDSPVVRRAHHSGHPLRGLTGPKQSLIPPVNRRTPVPSWFDWTHHRRAPLGKLCISGTASKVPHVSGRAHYTPQNARKAALNGAALRASCGILPYSPAWQSAFEVIGASCRAPCLAQLHFQVWPRSSCGHRAEKRPGCPSPKKPWLPVNPSR